jgi:two-component system chemotaxis response regulator CheY
LFATLAAMRFDMARSVLIVDDSSLVREALVRLFVEGGFEVCGDAESGRAAIEKAQGLNPGLIVMDFSMPGMNGIEAARGLRQLLPTAVIIILSDYGGMFREEETGALGIAAIVSKAECSSVLLHEARTLLH